MLDGDDTIDDEWGEDDITAIGAAELDASLDAIENFENFISFEDEDQLIPYQTIMDTGGVTDDDVFAMDNVPQNSQSYDNCIEEDKFLESINWDEVLSTKCQRNNQL